MTLRKKRERKPTKKKLLHAECIASIATVRSELLFEYLNRSSKFK